jgi:hypothetical protein
MEIHRSFFVAAAVAGLMVGLNGCTRPTTASTSETRTLAVAQQKAMESARRQLELIPPPSKTRYMAVKSLTQWENPYVTVNVGIDELSAALNAVPEGSWPYGRVVAVEEAHQVPTSALPEVRRNMETVMKTLNDLGVVVYEWSEQK